MVRKGALQEFITKYNPDILCLQETKAEQGQAEIDFSEYQEYWNSSRAKKGYSGTAIFTKIKPITITNDIPEKFIKIGGIVEDSFGDSNMEGRVISAEFEDFYIVTAYTPNAKDGLLRIAQRQQFDAAMTAYCDDLQSSKPVIYCGDMNVAHTEDDLANPKSNIGKKGFSEQERTGFDNWLNVGFIDTFRMFNRGNGFYTWWSNFANSRSRNIGWRIDYFLVSKSLKSKVQKAEIHPNQTGSDHCPISIEILP